MRGRAPLYSLFAADAISLAGNAVAQIAIPWFVLTTTGSATLTALVVFFNFLPIVLAAFFGGVLVAGFGATAALWLDAASFLVSACLVAVFVPRPHRVEAAEAPAGRFLAELADGLRFIWRHPLVRAIVAMVLLTNLIEAPGPVVLAVFAHDEYGSAADFGVLVGVLGGAALAGALAYSAIGHRLPRRRTFLVCFSGVPVGYLALAAQPSLPVALAALALAGFAAGPINPLLFTVQAEIVPSALRGRVFGAIRAGAWAAIPLGILLGGAVVAAIGAPATFLAMGVLLAAVVGYGFFNRTFREMDRSDADDREEVLLGED